jgi:hypothetical protein
MATNIEDNIKYDKKKKIVKIIFILFMIGAFLLLWARFISTMGFVVKEVKVDAPTLPKEYDGFKLVQFTDLHYGSTVYLEDLKKIVKSINKQKPDVVVFTGDLVEKGIILNDDQINSIIKELNKINPEIEVLTVKGNHDYDSAYYDLIIPKTNFIQLDNQYEYVYKNSTTPIIFVGLDDYLDGKPDYKKAFDYPTKDQDNFVIVLAHEPDQAEKYKGEKFNLILCGHSHLGQVRFPIVGALYTPNGSKKYYESHYKIEDADMYISGGLGTSTIKFRFMNKPEYTLYRFYTN